MEEDTDKLDHLESGQVPGSRRGRRRSRKQDTLTSSTTEKAACQVQKQTGSSKDT